MANHPETRFARIRLQKEDHPSATMTFVAADSQALPTINDHGVLSNIARKDPERAARLLEDLKALIGREAEVLTWIESAPENAHAFMKDPEAALLQALPDLRKEFFSAWREPASSELRRL